MLRPVNVATAAPVTPSFGNGPIPKMKHGSRIKLIMFDTHSSRIATAASPAPRKMALFKNKSSTTPLPPSAIRAYPLPVATIAGEAPINRKRSLA